MRHPDMDAVYYAAERKAHFIQIFVVNAISEPSLFPEGKYLIGFVTNLSIRPDGARPRLAVVVLLHLWGTVWSVIHFAANALYGLQARGNAG